MMIVKAGVAVAVLFACGLAVAHGATPLAGEMKGIDGKPVDLAAYKGKYGSWQVIVGDFY